MVRYGANMLSAAVSYRAADGAPFKTTRYFAAHRRAKPYPDGEKLAALGALALPVDGTASILCIELSICECAQVASGLKYS